MKIAFVLSVSFLCFLTFTHCSKNDECTAMRPLRACYDTPPVDQDCDAAFSRWFHNQDEGKCELISYSGCDQLGFETEEFCRHCWCSR